MFLVRVKCNCLRKVAEMNKPIMISALQRRNLVDLDVSVDPYILAVDKLNDSFGLIV